MRFLKNNHQDILNLVTSRYCVQNEQVKIVTIATTEYQLHSQMFKLKSIPPVLDMSVTELSYTCVGIHMPRCACLFHEKGNKLTDVWI